MALVRCDYDSDKVDNLLQMIQSAWNSGQKQEYEIMVDGLKVVHRTADPEPFTRHVDYIHENSKSLVIILYKGGSRNNEKYFFSLTGRANAQPLSGLPENMSLAEHDAKQKEMLLKEIRLEALEKENEELKDDVKEKQATIDQLSTRLQEVYDGKLITIGEMGSAVVMRLLQNPSIRKTFPVLEGIVPTAAPEQKAEPEQQASFSRKGETAREEENSQELTEEEERHLMLIHDLQERLSSFQLGSVMHILDILTRCPEAIGSTLKHLSNFVEAIKDHKKDEKV